MSTAETFDPHIQGVPVLEVVDFGLSDPLGLRELFSDDELVNVIGQHTLIETRRDGADREHHLVNLTAGAFHQTVWITQPASGHKPEATIATKPGLGEIIENGIGWEFHKELALELPEARIVTHGTYGFGPRAESLPLWDLTNYNLGRLAVMGANLLDRLPKDSPLVLVGTSLGTIIGNKMLVANLEREKRVAVDLVIYYAPALVPPERAGKNMLLHFATTFPIDMVRELTLRTDPRLFWPNLQALIASKPRLKDVLPTMLLIPDILRGTAFDEISKVAANYSVKVIEGEDDSVAEMPMWTELSEEFPNNLELIRIRGRGHAMAVKPKEKAHKIADTIRKATTLTKAA